MSTYVTTDELSRRIKYDARTIRERLIDSVLLEGRHYFRPFGGRKILFIWEHIEEDMQVSTPDGQRMAIPMANGSKCEPADQGHTASRPPNCGKATKAQSRKDSPSQGIPMANGMTAHG